MDIVTKNQGNLDILKELPAHIRYNEYIRMRQCIKDYWDQKNPRTSKNKEFYRDRDLLLVDLCWETGGRISDIAKTLTFEMFNFDSKVLKLWVQKVKRWLEVPLDNEILLLVSNFCRKHKVTGPIFRMTRQRAWQIIKAYGKMAAIENLHPHKFRHGIAIYLMEKGVPMPIISNRLGHSNPITTMRFYQRITPEIQRKMLEGIKWRE